MASPRKSVSGLRLPGAGITLAPGRVAALRKQKSWKREDLAEAAGLSVSTIRKIENRERRPRAATLATLCKALGCEPADLLPEQK
jgi:transcriptional regulator with XRE-family HTH domain